MPTITPQFPLPGVKLREFFPIPSVVGSPPAFAECLIGPARTVVYGEQGVLGGTFFNSVVPTLAQQHAHWDITVTWPATTGLAAMTVIFAGASFIGGAGGLAIPNQPAVFADPDGGVDYFCQQMIAAFRSNSVAGPLMGDVVFSTVSYAPTSTRRLIISASPFAIASGYFPRFQVLDSVVGSGVTPLLNGVTGPTSPAAPALATADFLSELGATPTLPTLASDWLSIQNRPVLTQILAETEVEKERFYFDATTRQRDALDNYLDLPLQSKAFHGRSPVPNAGTADGCIFVQAGVALPATITVGGRPVDGTQRVTAYSFKTGAEYELKYADDIGVVVADWTLTVPETGGAFQQGAVITLNLAGDVLSSLVTHDLMIRATYVPQRSIAPLPVFKYAKLLPNLQDIVISAPLTTFGFNASGSVMTAYHPAPPVEARFSYSTSARVTDVAGPLIATNHYVDINLAPTFAGSITKNASGIVNVIIPFSSLNAPNIDTATITVKTAGGATLTQGPDWDLTTNANSITILATGAGVLSINNPLAIAFRYSPYVTFVGTPDVSFSGSVTAPTIVSIGGGRYRVNRPGGVSAEIGSFSITAEIEYPVEPQIQLEFVAERKDLDGQLFTFTSTADITGNALLQDAYAGQVIPVDLTSANPTMHCANLAISVSGAPVLAGIGDMTPSRSQKILQVLERTFEAYHLVPISQDSDSILALVGAHIDKMVATFANAQIHFNTGKFRVVYDTLDQRNAVQLMPVAKDTLSDAVAPVLGKLVPGTLGGVAVLVDITQVSGTLAGVSPGDRIEFLQFNATPTTTITGSLAKRAAPARFVITSIDSSTPTATKINITSADLPAVLGSTEFHLERGAPFRILRVRDDFQLASDIKTEIQAIGASAGGNGRRRWIRQPDFVFMDDGGVTRVLPAFYRSVIEAAVRANSLPHQPLTRAPLPFLTGVNHNVGTYSSDDVIAIMIDGGADYATAPVPGGPVSSVKQLTADRRTRDSSSPTVVMVADFSAMSFFSSLDLFIGTTNVFPGTQEAISTVSEGVFSRLRGISSDRLGPMIKRGFIKSFEELDETSPNSGYKIVIGVITAEVLEEIDLDIFVNQAATTIAV
jgi:hypothetical protein